MENTQWAMFGFDDEHRLIARGPFTPSATLPASGTAFYRNNFALTDPQPWLIPATWEIIPTHAMPRVLLPEIDWQAPDSAAFAQVFQEISHAVRRGSFEKTVPVSVEHGSVKCVVTK